MTPIQKDPGYVFVEFMTFDEDKVCGECGVIIDKGGTARELTDVFGDEYEENLITHSCVRCYSAMKTMSSLGYATFPGNFLKMFKGWLVDKNEIVPDWVDEGISKNKKGAQLEAAPQSQGSSQVAPYGA